MKNLRHAHYSRPLSMYTRIVASSSLTLTIHSHDLQNYLHFAPAKDITLNTKQSTYKFANHDDFPIVPSNFPTNHSHFKA